jgi:hypothetical protein
MLSLQASDSRVAPLTGGVQLAIKGVGVTEPISVADCPRQMLVADVVVAEKEGVVET